MKGHFSSFISLYVLAGSFFLLNACANPGKPSGGEKDSRGPEVLGVLPPPGARNVHEREVVFFFDEFLKPGNYSKQVFISPIPKKRPEITVLNKRLIVKFNDELLPNTTYVITLGKDVKDFNEGNSMTRSFTYAFSTGDVLDTLSFGGRVETAWGGGGEEGMTVMLFPYDSIPGDSIFGRRPVYAFQTDNGGAFRFQYLRAGKYKVYGVQDIDNDFSYSQPKEKIALSETPVIDVADSSMTSLPFKMYSFAQDHEAPVVKSVKWSNDHVVHVEFGEEVRERYGDRNLQIFVQDSTGSNKLEIKDYRFSGVSPKHLFFQSPTPRKTRLDVAFKNVMDTLGHSADTVLKLPEDAFAKEDKDRLVDLPVFQSATMELVLPLYAPIKGRLDSSACHLKDSSGKNVPIEISYEDLGLRLRLKDKFTGGKKYTVVLDTALQWLGFAKRDTAWKLNYVFPDPMKFGSLSGVITGDSSKPGMHYVVILSGPPLPSANKKEKARNWTIRLEGPGPFSIPSMPEGTYQVFVIEDTDGNGFLTPGSLHPYRLPERTILGLPSIEIKGNWELKNHRIEAIRVKSEGKGKSLTESPENKPVPGKKGK